MLATSLPIAQWLERPTGVRKVMGSIPIGDSDFSLSHARHMLNIPSFLSIRAVFGMSVPVGLPIMMRKLYIAKY